MILASRSYIEGPPERVGGERGHRREGRRVERKGKEWADEIPQSVK